MGALRHYPCGVLGCPEKAVGKTGRCPAHARPAWAGRNGTTRREAMGVSTATWDKLRRAAVRRDGGRCRRCGGPGIEVDHLVPVAWRRPPVSFSAHLAGLLVLCGECHRAKTAQEAVIGRVSGSPPTLARIEAHVRDWGRSKVVT